MEFYDLERMETSTKTCDEGDEELLTVPEQRMLTCTPRRQIPWQRSLANGTRARSRFHGVELGSHGYVTDGLAACCCMHSLCHRGAVDF